ncbi:hypothetical protein OG322_12255 [Streptomyces sp. NBC_01260]|uniref:Integral membrane protein n=1 Tax=Streptomyces laculatispora TaxID=887464 RepID=A0ABY9I2V7_9ACTN|nr:MULTISPECIES: hypothetical protein [Streptomyces]MCX4770161.1 hypothetical protein [Streptomyces sp. NBC_01285]ROQ82439.1 hypothetical protein EDD95_2055 [Streptomyces sp. CEV 2-1]WLQ40974.1 hypothetical protein P8A22_13830 [Streptomyces laculatispora]
MSGDSGWGSGSTGHIPPGHGRGRPGDSGSLFPLARSWAVGALVHLIAGYLISRGLVERLDTDGRLDVFTWRLALLYVPAVITTALTVLAAARVLPGERRSSRLLYPLASLAVPLVALGYGYAVPWAVTGVEGVLMPVVTLVTGSAVGLAVDRLMEDDGTQSAAPGSYNWRDGGATATDYLGVILLVVTTVGVGGSI